METRALPAEEYAKLYEDYRAAVHSAAEYARSATRSQMSGRARDALQLCLSYRQSRERGGYDRNRLLLDTQVLHQPHSSRPWKQLKYTNPLRYYWQKLTQKRDRI